MIVKFVSSMKTFVMFMLSQHTAVKAVKYAKVAMKTISTYTCIQFREVSGIESYRDRHVLLFTALKQRLDIQHLLRSRTNKFGCVFMLGR